MSIHTYKRLIGIQHTSTSFLTLNFCILRWKQFSKLSTKKTKKQEQKNKQRDSKVKQMIVITSKQISLFTSKYMILQQVFYIYVLKKWLLQHKCFERIIVYVVIHLIASNAEHIIWYWEWDKKHPILTHNDI